MNAFYFYKKLGFTHWTEYREISNAAVATTIALHTPMASMKVVLTNLVVSTPINGSIAFYFHKASNQLQNKVLEVRGTSASATIQPLIEAIECTAQDCVLQVRVNTGATDAWSITAEGFDIE